MSHYSGKVEELQQIPYGSEKLELFTIWSCTSKVYCFPEVWGRLKVGNAGEIQVGVTI